MDKMQFACGGIILRPYEMKDVEPQVMAGRESVTEISPWMSWCHNDYKSEESRR